MLALILAQDRIPEGSYIAFALISIVYLFFTWLVIHKGSGTELIGLGLLTMVASVGYGSLVQPAGPVMAATMIRVAFLLILGGVVAQVLKSARVANPVNTTAQEESRE